LVNNEFKGADVKDNFQASGSNAKLTGQTVLSFFRTWRKHQITMVAFVSRSFRQGWCIGLVLNRMGRIFRGWFRKNIGFTHIQTGLHFTVENFSTGDVFPQTLLTGIIDPQVLFRKKVSTKW